MLLLAADTSGKQGSIALARGQAGGECEVIEVVALSGGAFSAELIPQIDALLTANGVAKREIGGFAVASGPGSFTGLRVGLAAIKALAEILRKPIASVSLLEAIARSGRARGSVLSALDAGRGEIYVGEYEVETRGAKLVREHLLSALELFKSATDRVVITPDKIVADAALGAGLRVEQIARPGSDVIAHLGWQKIEAGETVLPEALEANYVRRSDAELFSKTRN